MKDTLLDLVKDLRNKCMDAGYLSHSEDLDTYLETCDEAETIEEELRDLIKGLF